MKLDKKVMKRLNHYYRKFYPSYSYGVLTVVFCITFTAAWIHTAFALSSMPLFSLETLMTLLKNLPIVLLVPATASYILWFIKRISFKNYRLFNSSDIGKEIRHYSSKIWGLKKRIENANSESLFEKSAWLIKVIPFVCSVIIVILNLPTEETLQSYETTIRIIVTILGIILLVLVYAIPFFLLTFLTIRIGSSIASIPYYCSRSVKKKVLKLIEPFETEFKLQEEEEKRKKEREARERDEALKEKKRQQALEEKNRRRQEGNALYSRAIAVDPVNEELIEKAAELESPEACIRVAQASISDFDSALLTQAEKENRIRKAIKYLKEVKDCNTEAEYLLLVTRTMVESHDADTWKTMLKDARRIKASGELSDMYNSTVDTLIANIVGAIDRARGLEAERKSYTPSYSGGYTEVMTFDPHGKSLDESRTEVAKIISNPNISDDDKRTAVDAHNRWHLDAITFKSGTTYDMGPYGGS